MKIFWLPPTAAQIMALIERYQNAEFTETSVGSTRDWKGTRFDVEPNSIVENGYLIQRRRSKIGAGEADYRAAVAALRRGDCFDLPWVDFHSSNGLNQGAIFCLVAKAFGLRPASLCRIVYSEHQDNQSEDEQAYAVGIGTLPVHVARGEEKIAVAWNTTTDDVDLLIGSYSKPASWITRLFVWYLRQQQDRFALDSATRMRQAVQDTSLENSQR